MSYYWGGNTCVSIILPVCQRCGVRGKGVVELAPLLTLLKDARVLAHPDRHPAERREKAGEVTAELNREIDHLTAQMLSQGLEVPR